jgi:cytochrome c oxidase subunit 1
MGDTGDEKARRGGLRWLWSTDHKVIGVQYMIAALLMLLLAFVIVLLMRWQLAYPGKPIPMFAGSFGPNDPSMPNGIMVPTFYNQLGAMHGTLMIFMAVAPLLVGGFGSYLVPLMLGSRGMAFPRLGRLGFWCYLLGGGLILATFFTPLGPAASGWTSYAPLAVIEKSGQSIWLLGIVCVYFSSLILAINLIVTIVQHRAPGMGFMRLPFFVWSQLVTALLLLLAFPPLAAAGVMQLMDRVVSTSFFMPSGLVVDSKPLEIAGGGSALLWQHLFWFLAHPEVYVIILPALGIVAEIIANNTRKPLWGYRGMVGAALFLGLMSMLVWAHHMFLTGMGATMNTFFQATTLIISVPSMILGASLVLSLWGGAIRFTTPMLFALAFLPMFGLGGFTGIPLALAVTNIPLHDTYYVIGHFHYVVAPGTLFAIFAGIYHWYPKVTGRKMNDLLAKLHFWPTLLFMNGVFFPMLIQGFAGVERRLYDGGQTYQHMNEVFFLNKAATHSAFALGVFQIPFIINFFGSYFFGKRVGANPWDATTLEWQTTAPPPPGNFAELPRVYRGPCEYSVPGAARDFSPQDEAEGAA